MCPKSLQQRCFQWAVLLSIYMGSYYAGVQQSSDPLVTPRHVKSMLRRPAEQGILVHAATLITHGTAGTRPEQHPVMALLIQHL